MASDSKRGAGFTKDLFEFLDELRLHNERPWFEANKQRYEDSVKRPTLALLEALGPRMQKVSKSIVVDPRPVGGSMMRIYRDIRFSRDKTPYKTFVGVAFKHASGMEGAPSFYLHLEPGASMFGGGMWHPETSDAKRIRDAIASDSKGWQKATAGLLKKSACSFAGESLKRPPPGYPADHPCIEDLKRKDFCVSVELKDSEVLSPRFPDTLVDGARAMAPFMAFLAEAVGERF